MIIIYTRKLGKLIKTKWLTFYYAASEFSYYISSISFLAVKKTNNFQMMKRLVCVLHSQGGDNKKTFLPMFDFFFNFSFLCKLLLHYLRPKFCTQLRFLYFFFQKEYNNIWFTGHHLISLLDLVLSLPEGAETDLLQNSDRWVAIIVGSFSPSFII